MKKEREDEQAKVQCYMYYVTTAHEFWMSGF